MTRGLRIVIIQQKSIIKSHELRHDVHRLIMKLDPRWVTGELSSKAWGANIKSNSLSASLGSHKVTKSVRPFMLLAISSDDTLTDPKSSPRLSEKYE